MNQHQLAKVTYGSIIPPKISESNKRIESVDQKDEEDFQDEFPLYVHQPEPKNFPKSCNRNQHQIEILESNKEEKISEFYNRIKLLQIEQQKTFDLINKLSTDELCGQFESCENFKEENFQKSIFDEKIPQKNAFIENVLAKMWENFNYNDGISCHHTPEKKESIYIKNKSWKPIVTVPKPFKMTIREEKKKIFEEKKKQLQCKDTDEEEMKDYEHRHRAKTAPATTFIPLFKEINEMNEQRSRENRKNAFAITMAIQKPFTFDKREKIKKIQKEEELERIRQKEYKEIKERCKFKATPLPEEIFESSIYDQIKEEELYRKVKGRIRREELFLSASLPPRMKDQHFKEAEKKQMKMKKLEEAQRFSFKPQISEMPDFEKIHRQEMKKKMREEMIRSDPTPIQPFNLRASTRIRRKSLEEDSRSTFTTSYRPSSSTIPIRMSDSARRRMQSVRGSLQAKREQSEEKKKIKDQRKEQNRKLKKQIARSSAMIEAYKDPTLEERIEKSKEEMRSRQIEYQRFLREVKNKMEQRPLLVQQHDQKIAEDHAEKRFQEILQRSGVSEDNMNFQDTSSSLKDLKSSQQEENFQESTQLSKSNDFIDEEIGSCVGVDVDQKSLDLA